MAAVNGELCFLDAGVGGRSSGVYSGLSADFMSLLTNELPPPPLSHSSSSTSSTSASSSSQSPSKKSSQQATTLVRSQSQSQSQQNSELQRVKKLGQAIIQSYQLKVRRIVLSTLKAVQNEKNATLANVALKNELYLTKLSDEQKTQDASLLESVLNYYAILSQEMSAANEGLQIERTDKVVVLKQAAILRDLRYFACNLYVETKGRISLTMLHQESPQFERCVKAVMDNINTAITEELQMDTSTTKVLNVLKLQNPFLSKKLQVSDGDMIIKIHGAIKGCLACTKSYLVSSESYMAS
jgi:hypothetical protein